MALRASKVTRKGQVTIPAEIREKLDISEGDTVLFEEHDGRVELLRPRDLVDRTAGVLKDCAKNGPLEWDREEVWTEIAMERSNRLLKQLAEDAVDDHDHT